MTDTNWDAVGEDGLPVHCRFPLTADGRGPATGADFDHWGCWCADPTCAGPPTAEPEPTPSASASIRADIAHVVSAALSAEGFPGIPARSALAVADALLIRPGMLRAALGESASDRRTARPSG